MYIQVLKSKLKKVRVTAASVEYEGSLTLDTVLMEAANILPYERVEVNAVYGKDRLTTYVIPGEHGSGQVEMNGGMANFFKPGDEVHVNCFWIIEQFMRDPNGDRVNLWQYVPEVVKTDENNKIID